MHPQRFLSGRARPLRPLPWHHRLGPLYQWLERAAYRCHAAVVDPLGNVVILRQGRSDAGPGAFGWLHTLFDHAIELRVDGHGEMSVWVEVDRTPSDAAPDREPFGVVTAYCKPSAGSCACA